MKTRHLFALIITMSFTAFAYAGGLDMMTLKGWKIVVDKDAIASEKFAAEELQTLLQQATGTKLEISASAGKSKNIYIGYSPALQKIAKDFTINDSGKEGLKIKIMPENIIIAGGRPRGTLYGVYEFAEKYLGIRFLAYDYTYVPEKKKELVIPCEDHTYNPPFVYRSSYYKENIVHHEYSVRMRNNSFEKAEKFGGETDMQFIVHSFYRQVPVDSFGKTHPEYFAEVGGKRLLEAYGGGPQICVSNPEVIKIMTAAVLKEIKEHPEYKNVSIVQNDNQYYCTCKNCEAINDAEGTAMGSHLFMVNAVADVVAVQYPEVKVGTLAYQYNRKPTKTMKAKDNVMVQLCSIECDLLHAYTDAGNTMNKPFADDLAGWGKMSQNLWIWDYVVDYAYYGLPFPNLKSLGKNIKYYKDNNVKGVFMEANYSSLAGEMSDLRNYITSRCLWDPELDSWELTKEFCNLYYKKSAKPIMEYLTTIHNRVEEKNLKAKFNAKPFEVGLDAEFSNYILTKFEEALQVADDETIKRRVERAALSGYVAMIEAARGEVKYVNGKINYNSSDRYKEVLKKFPGLAKKDSMIEYSEGGPMADQEAFLNNELKVYANGGRPAIQLENNTWKITALTQENGKIVELFHKPTKRNFLSAYERNLGSSVFEESFAKGKNDKDTIKFTATIDKNTLNLTSTLKNGTQYSRKITLDESGNILCQSIVKNKTDSTRTYQLITDPIFDTRKRARDAELIKGFVKYKGKLTQFNKGLIFNHGPQEHLFKDAVDGGEVIFFNAESNFGLKEKYDSKQIEILNASWRDSGSLMSIGLKTKEFTLKPGETYTFNYKFEYLDKLPVETKK